jgi:hypothetical protein
MALHLNLLHEEILEQRQRQRDPLKIGIYVLAGFGALLLLYYMINAYRALEIRSRLGAVERNFKKIEPQVTAAQKRVTELEGAIKTAHALDDYINNRFFWGPFLQRVARCVSLNTQVTILDGNATDENKGISVSLEGVAAGTEPRAVAEDLRQALLQQLGRAYSNVKAEFKTLEDVDTIVNVEGTSMSVAHYVLAVNFNPTPLVNAAATPAPTHPKKR